MREVCLVVARRPHESVRVSGRLHARQMRIGTKDGDYRHLGLLRRSGDARMPNDVEVVPRRMGGPLRLHLRAGRIEVIEHSSSSIARVLYASRRDSITLRFSTLYLSGMA
jgi:hypothetical protein